MAGRSDGRKQQRLGLVLARGALLASVAVLSLGLQAVPALSSQDGDGGAGGEGDAGGAAGTASALGNGGGGAGAAGRGRPGASSNGGAGGVGRGSNPVTTGGGGGNSSTARGGGGTYLGGTGQRPASGDGTDGAGPGAGAGGDITPATVGGGGGGGFAGTGGAGGGPAGGAGGLADSSGGGGGGGAAGTQGGGGGGGGGFDSAGGSGGGGGARSYYFSGSTWPPSPAPGQLNGGGGGGGSFGAGGGGGGAGLVINTSTLSSAMITSAIAGGAGGGGGSGGTLRSGTDINGGGGGNGGTGLLLNGLGTSSIAVTGGIIGGGGGGGGNAGPVGGDGGNGARGISVQNNTGRVSLTISNSVVGGNGGAAGVGTSSGTAGAGGVGVSGGDLAVTVTASGLVQGGFLGGSTTTRALALDFTSGSNVLTLETDSRLLGGIGVSGASTALEFDQDTDYTLSSAISGDGTITKTGSGVLSLATTNTFSGAYVLNAGTLSVSSTNSLSSASGIQIAGGTLRSTATMTYNGPVSLQAGSTSIISVTGGTLTLGGGVSGGGLTKTGSWILSFSAANTYIGDTTITGGSVSVSNTDQLGSASNAIILDGGTLALEGGAQVSSRTVEVGAGNGTISLGIGASWSFSGTLTGSGNLTKGGMGTLAMSGDLSAFTGALTTGSGALSLEGNASFATASSVAVNGGFDISAITAAETSITNLTGNSSGVLTLGAKDLTVVQAAAGTYNGLFNGTGNITKDGTGTLTLRNASTGYTGAFTVSAGTLELSKPHPSITPTLGGSLDVASGATLIASGGTVVGAVTVRDGATLSSGQSSGGLSAGSLLLESGAITTVTLSDPLASTAVFVVTDTTAGALTVDGTLNVTSGTGYGVGVYRIFSSAGTLTDNGLALGTVPVVTGLNTALEIGTQTVDLQVTTASGRDLQYWSANGTSRGGSGSWTSANTWLYPDDTTGTWGGRTGVFDGTAGTVTVEGTQAFETVEFLTTGYSLVAGTGGSLDLGTGGRVWAEGADVTATISAPITGAGALTKVGSGTIILSGVNTYQGGTVLSAGTLQVDADAALGAAAGGLTFEGGTLKLTSAITTTRTVTLLSDGGTLRWSGAAPLTMSGTISGAGGLTLTGGGLFSLTGSNIYEGGTVVTGGSTLVVEYDSNLGATSGALTLSGGTLAAYSVFDPVAIARNVVLDGSENFLSSDTRLTLSGTVSGTGGFTANGTGTLVLAGVNSYVGGTTIVSGTVQVANDANLGATSGGLTLNGGTLATTASFSSARAVTLASGGGTLSTAEATSLTLSGTISGSGALVKDGAGTLILTGTNTYTGGTTINAGTLQIGDGGTTGSILGDVVNNASLVFNRSDTYSFPGNITGTGSVTFIGGTVLFATPGAYTGPIVVESGRVALEAGAVSSSIFTVGSGGIIAGNGTIGGLVVDTGGTAAPGNSPGTIAVNGTITFNSGSTYRVDVTPDGQHDLITATGAVTINNGASVLVVAEPGAYAANSTYTILTTTGTLTGTFGSVTSDYAFLAPSLSYDAQNVYLTLAYNGVGFSDLATTFNQANVAVAAQNLPSGNAVYDALVVLPTSAVAPAFNQLSGEAYASVNTVIQQEAVYLRDAVGARLRQGLAPQGAQPLAYAARAAGPATAQLSEGLTPTLWMQGYGGWGTAFGNTNAASISSTIGGFLAGLDVAVGGNSRVGLVAGYSQSQFDVTDRNSNGSMGNYDIGLYGGTQIGALALRGGLSYTWHDVSMDRSIVFPGFSGTTASGYTQDTTQVFGELAYDLTVGGYAFEPFLGLAYLHLSGASTQESPVTAAALSVNVGGQDTFYTTLGLRAATSLSVMGRTLTPSLTLGWQHAFGDITPVSTMRVLGGPTPFQVEGVPIAENTAILGAGLAYALSDLASIQVNYSGQIAAEASQNAFTAQFSLRF